jgi:DNA mismatch repair protein MutL
MSFSIQPLPTEVIHLIAAGEVIDSLAAVVRELAENALDANATRIVISVWLDQWRIRVADNGTGITPDNLRQAATSHSTSKIRSSQDLWHIHSLGFRGEALHSLAQLSELEICSRTADTDGWRVQYNHQGEVESMTTVAIATGTVVTVSNLFGHWTVRRDSLPPPTQQLRLLQATIHHLALCHPQVTWQVQQGDREWFSIWASASAQQTLPQILRDVQPSDLQLVHWQPAPSQNSRPAARLDLVIGLPDRCHRHRLDWVKVGVNGRVVKCPELEQSILGAFRRTLPRDRYPLCFVHLHVPPSDVDWNRHPAKAEIYLRSISSLQQAMGEAIDQALRLGSVTLPDSAYSSRVGRLIQTADGKVAEEAGKYDAAAGQNPEDEEDALPYSPTPLPHSSLKAVAQVHSMYILAEHPAGMWLVEQHIAHERILYEQLCDRWEIVALESPVILPQLTPTQLEQLQRLDIAVDPFGEQLWAVRTAPEPLAQRADCTEAIVELSLGGNLEAALVATACRTAIRNGTPLSLPAMQDLLDRWQQTRNPRTCPHGRPIYLPLAETSLARFFRRHWVIGKSHGI